MTESDFEIAPLNRTPLAWEIKYNTYRPHQALSYLAPHQYLLQNYSINGKEKVHGIY